jgi:hypothetical protein
MHAVPIEGTDLSIRTDVSRSSSSQGNLSARSRMADVRVPGYSSTPGICGPMSSGGSMSGHGISMPGACAPVSPRGAPVPGNRYSTTGGRSRVARRRRTTRRCRMVRSHGMAGCMARCVRVTRRGSMLRIPTRMTGRRGMSGSSRVWRGGGRVWLMLSESCGRSKQCGRQPKTLPQASSIHREIHRASLDSKISFNRQAPTRKPFVRARTFDRFSEAQENKIKRTKPRTRQRKKKKREDRQEAASGTSKMSQLASCGAATLPKLVRRRNRFLAIVFSRSVFLIARDCDNVVPQSGGTHCVILIACSRWRFS